MNLKIADMLGHLRAHDEPERDGYKLVHAMDAGMLFPRGEDRESCRAKPFFIWIPTVEAAWEREAESGQGRPDSGSELRANDDVRTHYAPTPPPDDDEKPGVGRPRGVSLRF